RALVRDDAAIVSPDPGEQVFVVWANWGRAEPVDPGQDALEASRPGMVAQKGVADTVVASVVPVEVAALPESKGLEAGEVGPPGGSLHACYNAYEKLLAIVAG